jgi:hypothetical protein
MREKGKRPPAVQADEIFELPVLATRTLARANSTSSSFLFLRQRRLMSFHGDALGWLWWLFFAICAGSTQGLAVLLIMSRIKASLRKIHSKVLRTVTFSSVAFVLGILFLVAVFFGTALVGPVVYNVAKIDIHEIATTIRYLCLSRPPSIFCH